MRGRVSRCVAWHVAQSFLAVIAFAWLISPSTAAATTFTVDSTVVNVGAGFQLDVGIADVTDLFAYQVSVAFDPTRVQLSSITEGTFLWDDGTPVQLTNWNTGEPNDAGGAEDCIEIIGSLAGKWNDVPCAPTATSTIGSYPFVCERD